MNGKHFATFLPTDIPETGEPELSEHIIRIQGLQIPLQEPLKKETVSQKISFQKEQITGRNLRTASDKQPGKNGEPALGKIMLLAGICVQHQRNIIHYSAQVQRLPGVYTSATNTALKIIFFIK